MIVQAFNWWSEGLASGLSGFAGGFRRARVFRLGREGQGFVLRPSDAAGAAEIRLGQGTPTADVLQQTRGSIIEIAVPAAAILERRLDLPGESLPFVENVVRHQIEGLFPWRAADVVYTTRIEQRADGRLDVAVRATAQSAIARALAAAAGCGASQVVIVGEGKDGVRIPVASGAAGRIGADASRRIARYAIAALLVLTVGVVGWTSYARWSLQDDIASLDQAIADRRAILKRAAEARGKVAGGSLDARKQKAVVAVATLDALSSVLPDDTHLTDLTLDAGRLRMTGLSARATELVPLLEGSGNFRNAAFNAPMTRTPGRSADRFSIEAVVVPHPGGTP